MIKYTTETQSTMAHFKASGGTKGTMKNLSVQPAWGILSTSPHVI